MGAHNSVSAEKRIAPPGDGAIAVRRNCGARHRVRRSSEDRPKPKGPLEVEVQYAFVPGPFPRLGISARWRERTHSDCIANKREIRSPVVRPNYSTAPRTPMSGPGMSNVGMSNMGGVSAFNY
jgi:hypothetical protein